MNNRARHIQYRKSIYRKKRMKAIFIICGAALLVLFILFLIIGNALNKKTSDDPRQEQQTQSNKAAVEGLTPAKNINGYALKLLEDGSTFADRLAALPQNTSAVSLAINDTDGTLLFRSALSADLPFLSTASDASALSAAISRTDARDIYVSAILYVPSFSEENDLLRDVYLSAWCSIAVEALRAGAGDCMLVFKGAGANELDKICEIADLVRSIEPNAILGCAIPEDVISASANEVMISKLARSFNYLALDTTNYKEDEDVASYVEARISQFQMQLIYHKMRVLIPSSSDEAELQKYIDSVAKYNILSWQVKP